MQTQGSPVAGGGHKWKLPSFPHRKSTSSLRFWCGSSVDKWWVTWHRRFSQGDNYVVPLHCTISGGRRPFSFSSGYLQAVPPRCVLWSWQRWTHGWRGFWVSLQPESSQGFLHSQASVPCDHLWVWRGAQKSLLQCSLLGSTFPLQPGPPQKTWKVVAEWLDVGFLASGGDEFNPGPETRLDRSELLCNKFY